MSVQESGSEWPPHFELTSRRGQAASSLLGKAKEPAAPEGRPRPQRGDGNPIIAPIKPLPQPQRQAEVNTSHLLNVMGSGQVRLPRLGSRAAAKAGACSEGRGRPAAIVPG